MLNMYLWTTGVIIDYVLAVTKVKLWKKPYNFERPVRDCVAATAVRVSFFSYL